jgi:hypothetical protein
VNTGTLIRVRGRLRRTHYTPEQIATVKRLWAQGWTLEAIRAHTGLMPSTVYYLRQAEVVDEDAAHG